MAYRFTFGSAAPERRGAVFTLGGDTMPAIPIHAFDVAEATDTGGDTVERIRRAFEHVESRGNPNAVSPSGTFVGLYQMGPAAARDVGLTNRHVLIGNPELATWAWRKYMTRYIDRHDWHPLMAAVLWKAGPGTAAKVRKAVPRPRGPFDPRIVNAAEQALPGKNVTQYLTRFMDAPVWNR